MQSLGLEIIIEFEQDPLVALIVTAEPIVIPVIEFPETVPIFEVIIAPELTVTETLYVPLPEQIPVPALIVGEVHPSGGLLQLVGETTVLCVVAQPFNEVEVKSRFVPTGTPVTILLAIVPTDAVTTPLLLKLTL